MRSGAYMDADSVIQKAEQAGQTLCEYLESQETDPAKRGRRDRIIQNMTTAGCMNDVRSVIEIGTGTGMYMDGVISQAAPQRYEIYETNCDWRQFLKRHVRNFSVDTTIYDASGHDLSESADDSADLVHAHGVFVYLPTIQTFEYLQEMARVCRPNGFIVFDCYLDTSFNAKIVDQWIDSGWRFPVVQSQPLLEEWYRALKLNRRHRFTEVHGASSVDYEILQKHE